MSQTQRTVAEILALFADNTDQDISPQDMRDGFITIRPAHGQLYVPSSASDTVTISDSVSYFEATGSPAWTLSTERYLFDESAGNGRLTYTGVADVICLVNLAVSMTVAGNNQTAHFRIGKSGTTDEASELIRFVSTGADVGSSATQLITTLSTGDYVSAWARNATSTGDVTLEVASLRAVTMPS